MTTEKIAPAAEEGRFKVILTKKSSLGEAHESGECRVEKDYLWSHLTEVLTTKLLHD